VITANPRSFNTNTAEIKAWQRKMGQYCMGCVKGAMKEHMKYNLSKPLRSTIPGEINAGDLMFIETKGDTKKPLLIDVDVATKLITVVVMRDKSEAECTKALLQVKNEYALYNHQMKMQVFDRESGIVPLEDRLKEHGIQLRLMAARHKVGLAEVNIRVIQIKY
jgi:hypothetical protein